MIRDAKHSVDKGEALIKLEPLLERATRVGNQIIVWFGMFEKGELDEPSLISHIQKVASEIDVIIDESGDLPFPPQDLKDYENRAQSLFSHLANMALYYSDRGIENWSEKNRTFLMRRTVEDFRADLDRLRFEREKIH